MNSSKAIHLLENHPPAFLAALNAELKANLGTSHYHRLSEQELSQRHFGILRSLTDWLEKRDEAELRMSAEELGRRRFGQGVPLGQVMLVLIVFEKHILTLLNLPNEGPDAQLRAAFAEFFQKFMYFTAKGYEAVLSAASKLASEDVVLQPVTAMPGHQREQDMEISRGGQVGETGG